jgi:hypothetical protein
VPARQRGSTVRRGKSWGARYYDEAGARRFRGGFETKTEARDWLDSRLGTVEALRRGDVAALRRKQMPTLSELVEEFTAQHVAEDTTIASLKFRLRYALEGPKLDGKAGWSDVKIDRLNPVEIGAWRKALPTRSAFGIHKCLRQVLHYAVRAKLIDETRPRSCRTQSRSERRCRRSHSTSWTRSRRSSPPRSEPSRCLQRSPVFARASGWRSSKPTSIAKGAW